MNGTTSTEDARVAERRARFAAIVRAHHAAVYRAAWHVLRDEHAALDVTQQVYLRAFEQGARFGAADDPAKVLCWNASKLALSRLRDDRRRARHEHRSHTETKMSDVAKPTHDVVLRNDEERAVRRAIDELDEDLRLSVCLRFESGLTIAQIGSMLHCAQSTVHERLQRGLERMRVRLRELGFGAIAVRLPDAIGDVTPPVVPAGVEHELLRLAATAGATTVGAAVATAWLPRLFGVVALATLAVVGIANLFVRDDLQSPTAQPVALHVTGNAPNGHALSRADTHDVAETPSISRQPIAATAPAAAATGEREVETGTFFGRVLDIDGAPIAAAEIVASSIERRGKQSRFVAITQSDADGEFRLSVPVSHVDFAQMYQLAYRADGHRLVRSAEVAVRAGASFEMPDIRLPAWLDDRPGDYRLEVALVDAEGAPIEGARVESFRLVQGQAFRRASERDSSAVSDARGIALLEGSVLGEKELVVHAESLGFIEQRQACPLDRGGAHVVRITLRRGASVGGRLRTVDGSAVPEWFSVSISRQPAAADAISVRADADGRFEFHGLEAGEHFVWSRWGGWSPFTLPVDAGTLDLDIALKREHDPRDVGTHDGELHGRVVDAATGIGIDVGGCAVLPRVVESVAGASDADLRAMAFRPRNFQVASGMRDETPPNEFHLTGLGPARYVLVAEDSGYATSIVGPFDLRDGRVIGDIVIPLTRGTSLRGRVVDPAGAPVEGAFVGLFGDAASVPVADDLVALDAAIDPNRGVPSIVHAAQTDARGEFEFTHVPTDLRLRLAAVSTQWRAVAGPRVIAPAAEVAADVELRFRERR